MPLKFDKQKRVSVKMKKRTQRNPQIEKKKGMGSIGGRETDRDRKRGIKTGRDREKDRQRQTDWLTIR